MKKLLFISFFCTLTLQCLFAQQDPQYTHNMFNHVAVNPGAAGNREGITATVLQRLQWWTFDGAPTTTLMTIDAAIQPFGIKSGVGLSIVNDQEGVKQNFGLRGIYAYRTTVGTGELGIGSSFGIGNYALDGAQLKGKDPDEHIPQGTVSKINFDMGVGAFYNTEKLSAGISVNHLTMPSYQLTETASTRIRPHYYLFGGYNLSLTSQLEMQPSLLIKFDGAAVQFDINTLVVYNKKFWGGVTYRAGSMAALLGIELINGVKLGISYDQSLSRFSRMPTAEVLIKYNFNITVKKIPQQYKSIRFL